MTTKRIPIDLPIFNRFSGRFEKTIPAFIVPDIAPHLSGTFAVAKAADSWGNTWRGFWLCWNVETGTTVRSTPGKSLESAARFARVYIASKTQSELETAWRKVRRQYKGIR